MVKKILIHTEKSVEETQRIIKENIENKKHFFSADPDVPFYGTCENRKFKINMHDFDSRFSPFDWSEGTLEKSEVDNGTNVTVLFAFDWKLCIFYVVLGLVMIFFMEVEVIIPVCVILGSFLVLIIKFFYRIQKIKEELEYILCWI